MEVKHIELRATICQLNEATLRELCVALHIEVQERDTGRLALIKAQVLISKHWKDSPKPDELI